MYLSCCSEKKQKLNKAELYFRYRAISVARVERIEEKSENRVMNARRRDAKEVAAGAARKSSINPLPRSQARTSRIACRLKYSLVKAHGLYSHNDDLFCRLRAKSHDHIHIFILLFVSFSPPPFFDRRVEDEVPNISQAQITHTQIFFFSFYFFPQIFTRAHYARDKDCGTDNGCIIDAARN